MIFEQAVDIPSPIDDVWALVSDLESVSRCVPGVDSFQRESPTDASGVLRLAVGPITTRLAGTVTVIQQDAVVHRSVVRVTASDPRIGSRVSAEARMTLTELEDSLTRLTVWADFTLLGRLGSFGQPVIRRKAEQVIAEFASNLARALEG